MSLNVIASMSIAVCMGFVYNQSAEGIGTVMRITVASGVILMLLSLAERMAPGLLDILFFFVLFCVSFKLSYRTEAIEYARRRPLRG